MSYSGRVVRMDDVLDFSECEEPNIARAGALMFKAPDELYWRAHKLGATPTQAKILGLLAKFTHPVPAALIALLLPGEESADNAVQVHIHHLRRLLNFATNGAVKIRNDHGEGYRLVVEE